jgi:hypothetical protein
MVAVTVMKGEAMAETRPPAVDYSTRPVEYAPEASGWVGWVLFAGVMLFLIGAFQGMAGLVALLKDDYFVTTSNNLVISVSYTTWGWVHLVIGVVALFAGWGVVRGRMWARAVGITLAFVSAVSNLAFLGAYPVWGVILITVDVIVIYALAVHGREAKLMR